MSPCPWKRLGRCGWCTRQYNAVPSWQRICMPMFISADSQLNINSSFKWLRSTASRCLNIHAVNSVRNIYNKNRWICLKTSEVISKSLFYIYIKFTYCSLKFIFLYVRLYSAVSLIWKMILWKLWYSHS